MRHRFCDRRYDTNGKDEIEVLLVPILFSGFLDGWKYFPGHLITTDNDTPLVHRLGRHGQELGGDIAMNKHGLHRIAYAGPLRFRVDHDIQGHLEVRLSIDIVMAIAHSGFYNRYGTFLDYRTNQAGAAPWNQHINIDAQMHKLN